MATNEVVCNNELNATIREQKTSEKYIVALKLVNNILVNIGKSQIDDLTDFKHIVREDIIKEENKIVLQNMENELFPLFNKAKVGYYRKTNALVLNCLRGMMKEMGYKLVKIQRELNEEINGKKYKRAHMIYYIK